MSNLTPMSVNEAVNFFTTFYKMLLEQAEKRERLFVNNYNISTALVSFSNSVKSGENTYKTETCLSVLLENKQAVIEVLDKLNLKKTDDTIYNLIDKYQEENGKGALYLHLELFKILSHQATF